MWRRQQPTLPTYFWKRASSSWHNKLRARCVNPWQRTVPYQGQETVLDLLQRIGIGGSVQIDSFVARIQQSADDKTVAGAKDLQMLFIQIDMVPSFWLADDRLHDLATDVYGLVAVAGDRGFRSPGPPVQPTT